MILVQCLLRVGDDEIDVAAGLLREILVQQIEVAAHDLVREKVANIEFQLTKEI